MVDIRQQMENGTEKTTGSRMKNEAKMTRKRRFETS